jgi:hypothetical protein
MLKPGEVTAFTLITRTNVLLSLHKEYVWLANIFIEDNNRSIWMNFSADYNEGLRMEVI